MAAAVGVAAAAVISVVESAVAKVVAVAMPECAQAVAYEIEAVVLVDIEAVPVLDGIEVVVNQEELSVGLRVLQLAAQTPKKLFDKMLFCTVGI